jgi:hypothetical protein
MPKTQKMKEIEMTVMEVESLPEKFRPPPTSSDSTAKLPGPLADLIQEATSGLTAAERGAFLDRLRDENPEVFSEGLGGNRSPSKESLSEEEWRKKLTHWLKQEANRFMAAAAGL